MEHNNIGRHTAHTVHPPVLPTSQSRKAHRAYNPSSSSANISTQRLFSDESITWPFHFFKPRRNILYNLSVPTFGYQLMRINFKHQFPLMFPNLYHLLFPLITLLSGFQTKIFYKFVVSHACHMTHQARPPNNIYRRAKYAEPPDYVIFFIFSHFLSLMYKHSSQRFSLNLIQ